jgi:single-stranded-DNA-specific exonuclease
MPKSWRFPAFDEAVVRQISSELKLPVLVAQVLAARGFQNGAEARDFLTARIMDLHDPNLLPGVSEAADLIFKAAADGRRITIYGDYDVDGVTSTSILWHCLQLLEANVDYYIPSRLDEGYGLNCDAIRQLHTDDPNRVVVSVDCGITSVKEAELAKELGLDLIITDHHQMADSLPDAKVLVHPRLPGSEYPFSDLCGAGVAFKLAWAICQREGDGKKASPRMREFLKSAVGLAAIGTVADVVPLVGENRILVKYGLESLVERRSVGLEALMKTCKLNDQSSLQAEDIGFGIGPRINAAGRLGQARLAVELLTTDDADRAKALADYLEQLNKNRQTVERRILKQAKEMVAENPDWQDDPVLVLAHADWHAGVIGIVASRVAEYFERPTVMISLSRPDEPGQGSCRSYAGFDLHSGLKACREHLVTFGGHKVAAGLKVEHDKLDDFRQAMVAYVKENHQVSARDLELRVDAEVRLADLTWKAVKQLEQLGPFGEKNPRPVFAASKVEVVGEPKKMGEGDRHLTMRVRHYGKVMRAVAFGQGDWVDEIAALDGSMSISFKPVINTYRDRQTVEMHLQDWQPTANVNENVSDKDDQVAAAS